MYFMKSTCGCWFLGFSPNAPKIKLLDCADESQEIFFHSDTTNPSIVEHHSIDSPQGEAWVHRISNLLFEARQHRNLLNSLTSSLRLRVAIPSINGVPTPLPLSGQEVPR